MKSAFAVAILVVVSAKLSCAIQSPRSSAGGPGPSLDSVVQEVQRAARETNSDIALLRIDKWKADSSEKAQMQKVADSLQKNISQAVPDLLSDIKASNGSVSSTFKLYNNISVVLEYLNSLTDASGSLGKPEEYERLNRDASALDKAREDLSTYIEKAATTLESKAHAAEAAATPVPSTPQPTPKKIVVDDSAPAKKTITSRNKKTYSPSARPTPTP